MFDSQLDEFINDEARIFYAKNASESINTLLLKYRGDVLATERVIQLDARNRAKNKLPTWLKSPQVVLPPKANLEQASSEETAIYKANIIPFKTSIDLTGGTAVDSWQFALKANKHIYVEPNEGLVKLAKHNFNTFSLTNVEFIQQDAESFMSSLKSEVDLIYLDPSRRSAGRKVFQLENYTPNVAQLLPSLLTFGKHILIKVSPLADLTQLGTAFYPFVKAFHVVAVKNECKEVLVLLSSNPTENPMIHTVNLQAYSHVPFSFRKNEEPHPALLTDKLEKYIYEPNAAVLKAGAFNSISNQFNLLKIHKNSHLYTSSKLINDFPGKVYNVLEVGAPFKLSKTYEPISIATRNFPQPVAAIRKKLKWKDGDAYKLFATTLGKNKCFIVGKEIIE